MVGVLNEGLAEKSLRLDRPSSSRGHDGLESICKLGRLALLQDVDQSRKNIRGEVHVEAWCFDPDSGELLGSGES